MGGASSLFLATDSRRASTKNEDSVVTIKPLKPDNSIDHWILETKRILTELPEADVVSNLPSWLQHELLLCEDPDFHDLQTEKVSLETRQDFLIKGVPRRPLYKELARRLFQWNQRIQQSKVSEGSITKSDIQLLVPAEKINLEELQGTTNSVCTRGAYVLPNPPDSIQALGDWFEVVGAFAILRLLGMRHTIGSDGGVIPSRKRLLEACREIHKPNRSKLTVAARARSKHAHRSISQESVFGVAKGPAEVQNQQTEAILNQLLEDAVWINRHRFVGLEEGTVAIEIRVLEGYGARWILDTKDDSITFRGFLEPQMKDGHERKWRH